MPPKWTEKDIPPLNNRSFVVTGTGGIGFETALALARSGGDVVIAGRNAVKGANAVADIKRQVPDAQVAFREVDLGSLASVSAFAKALAAERPSLDVLINNAGVMNPPKRTLTTDGFELMFGTNYLGHFALTAHLMPLLKKGKQPRVVSVSSVAARGGAIAFDNLQGEREYKPMANYGQSKLACLMFAFELQRRSRSGGWGVESIGAHPGVSRTDLIPNGSGRNSAAGFARRFLWFLFQPAAQGALPSLFAATSADVEPGGYYGPDRMSETRGHPTRAVPPKQSLDAGVASRLWDVSERLTGARFA
jgi:NAD(P)-dependent dehydrogenase (short-subunit alcohol dehydrogenase family)